MSKQPVRFVSGPKDGVRKEMVVTPRIIFAIPQAYRPSLDAPSHPASATIKQAHYAVERQDADGTYVYYFIDSSYPEWVADLRADGAQNGTPKQPVQDRHNTDEGNRG